MRSLLSAILSIAAATTTSRCGGAGRKCEVCDANSLNAVVDRESKHIHWQFARIVEDLRRQRDGATKILLQGGGLTMAKTSLTECDNGPGTGRTSQYCTMGLCPEPCEAFCPARDDKGGFTRNWVEGSPMGKADCDPKRTAELWYGEDTMNNAHGRFAFNGDDSMLSGMTGLWSGGRTLRHDVAVSDTMRFLMEETGRRNPMVKSLWFLSSSLIWAQWPPMSAVGRPNWTMADLLGKQGTASDFLFSELIDFVDTYLDSSPYFEAGWWYTPQQFWSLFSPTPGLEVMSAFALPWIFTGDFMGVRHSGTYLGTLAFAIPMSAVHSAARYVHLSPSSACALVDWELRVLAASTSSMRILFGDPDMEPGATDEGGDSIPLLSSSTASWLDVYRHIRRQARGTTEIMRLWVQLPNHTVAEELLGRRTHAYVATSTWEYDAEDGDWSLLCMVPGEDLDRATVYDILAEDNEQAIAVQSRAADIAQADSTLDLQLAQGDVATGGGLRFVNSGMLSLCFAVTSLPAGVEVQGRANFCLAPGKNASVTVALDTGFYPPGHSIRSASVAVTTDGYADCFFAHTAAIVIDVAVVPSSCPAGQFVDIALSTCTPCPPGTAKASAGSETCAPCGQGLHTGGQGGQAACTQCPPGSSTDGSLGTPTCASCKPGTSAGGWGQVTCSPCEQGRWQSTTAATVCHPCPGGGFTTQFRGALSQLECACPQGFWELPAPGTCSPCPEGIDCASFNSSGRVRRGFYAGKEDLRRPFSGVWSCPKPELCPGGPPESCTGKLMGIGCLDCPASHYRDGSSCNVCKSGNRALVFLVALGMLFLLVALYHVSNGTVKLRVGCRNSISLSCAIVLTVVQLLGLLHQVRAGWPSFTEAVMAASSVTLIGTDALQAECSFGSDYVLRYAVRILPPLMLPPALAFVLLLTKALAKFRGQEQLAWTVSKTANTLFLALNCFFVPLVSVAVVPYQCFVHPNGQESLLNFPAVLCGSKDHGVFIGLSVLLWLAIILPFIIILGYASFWPVVASPPRSSHRAPSEGEESTPEARPASKDMGTTHMRLFRFTLFRYHPQMSWWGVVILARQLLLSFAPAVSPNDPQGALLYVVFLLVFYSLSMGFFSPWTTYEHSMLDGLSMTIVALVFVSNGPLMAPSENRGAYEQVQAVLLCVLFALLGAVVLYTAVALVRRSTAEFGVPVPRNEKRLQDIALLFMDVCGKYGRASVQDVKSMVMSLHKQDRLSFIWVTETLARKDGTDEDLKAESWLFRRVKIAERLSGITSTIPPTGEAASNPCDNFDAVSDFSL